MLDLDSWLPQAKALAEGHKRRVEHNCGEGRTLLVEHRTDSYRAYCWRCSDHGFQDKQVALAERIARLSQRDTAEHAIKASGEPPSPANHDVQSWPDAARLWLYKAGFSNPDIRRMGAYYHEPTHRVVLPVENEHGKVIHWQARALDWKKGDPFPKYVAHGDKQMLVAAYGKGPTLVLTEDLLSAYRVGRVTEAWSLLGTSMSDAVCARVMLLRRPVGVWLDGDAPGMRAADKIVKQLRSYGVDVRCIRTDRDPKLYSQREIRATLTRFDLASNPASPRAF